MNTAVIYTSQTGFTKRYAQWIAEATNADCLELSKAKTKNMDHYNTIIFGGWACTGGIKKLKWFKLYFTAQAGLITKKCLFYLNL